MTHRRWLGITTPDRCIFSEAPRDLMARELRLEAAEVHPPAGDVDLSAVELDVYDGRDGWWNPQHDVVDVPEDWEFLTTGQAFVTRTVKAGGVFWLAWAPRSRTWRHRRLLGLWARGPLSRVPNTRTRRPSWHASRVGMPAPAVAPGRRLATRPSWPRPSSTTSRSVLIIKRSRRASPPRRTHAAVVGSGRVGRTRVLTLAERAALAARAEIQHAHTHYHQQLAELNPFGEEDDLRHAIKAEAHDAVDTFLDSHRQQLPQPAAPPGHAARDHRHIPQRPRGITGRAAAVIRVGGALEP